MGWFEGRVALVTGGASGIGRATALAFARERANVVVADLQADAGEKVAAEIRALGADGVFAAADVTDEAQVEALVATALERFGGLDCAVNNAGVSGSPGPLQATALADWSRTLAVNLTSVFLCMKHEIPALLARGGGAIVNVASGAGLIAVPYMSPYAASKHGVLGLTKTAAVENAATGIRINAVCPGSTDTPMLRATMDASPEVEKMILASAPGGRLGRAEEVAEAALWLCSDRASFVTGESMLVDGGAVAR